MPEAGDKIFRGKLVHSLFTGGAGWGPAWGPSGCYGPICTSPQYSSSSVFEYFINSIYNIFFVKNPQTKLYFENKPSKNLQRASLIKLSKAKSFSCYPFKSKWHDGYVYLLVGSSICKIFPGFFQITKLLWSGNDTLRTHFEKYSFLIEVNCTQIKFSWLAVHHPPPPSIFIKPKNI